MIILKSIGAFFVRIWRWIKETAWVQPLLIVGAIFAVIFSIPSITSAVNSWTANANADWLLRYRQSLNNEGYELEDAIETDADAATRDIYNATRYAYGDVDETAKSAYESLKSSDPKFFLAFLDSSTSDATTITEAFKYLYDNWDNDGYGLGLNDNSYLPFNLKVIYTDEESDNDDDYEDQNSPSAFSRYLSNHADLFNITAEYLNDRPYQLNASISDDKYDSFGLNSTSSTEADLASIFPKPSILLCDFTDKAEKADINGVSEIVFSVTGDTALARSQFLVDMWNHTDSYESDPNNLFLEKK